MDFNRLVFLLPCRGLDDLSLQRGPDEAEQLLSAWCALWHPALMHHAQSLPQWVSAEEPSPEPSNHIVVVPPCCELLLPPDWANLAEKAGARLIRNHKTREMILAAALKHLEGSPQAIDPELAADFQALGFCHCQVEILTRKFRYSSNLDLTSFQFAVLAAAADAVQGNIAAAKGNIQSAFDRLHEAREYYYPTEPHLLDLTLVAPTTLGVSLRDELAGNTTGNLLISGMLVQEMAVRQPATLARLQERLEQNTCALIGGEWTEVELPLLTPEAIRLCLAQGLESYQRHLGARPVVFGRRLFGLTPVLPQILRVLDFAGAVHCTLDDGRFPSGNQSRIQWEGIDGSKIEALSRIPIDISHAGAFLGLPEILRSALDQDNSATVVMAHWPGQSSPWYRDLQRVARYSAALGTFVTIADYFERTSNASYSHLYGPNEYRSPYLQQVVAAAEPDPISRWVRYCHRRAKLEAAQSLQTMAAACGSSAAACGAKSAAGDLAEKDDGFSKTSSTSSAMSDLLGAVEGSRQMTLEDAARLDRSVDEELRRCLIRFRESLSNGSQTGPAACLAVNPCSFSRGISLRKADLREMPSENSSPSAVGESTVGETIVVDLPAMGFAWTRLDATSDSQSQSAQRKGGFLQRFFQKKGPPLAEGNILSNEFLSATVDPQSGALRSIFSFNARQPRIGQQIALRLTDGRSTDQDHDSHYTSMIADEVAVTSPGPKLGEIVSRGRLMDRQSQQVARFRQAARIWQGSRVIELEIELDIDRLPLPNPWNSYYGVRFAWADTESVVFRAASLGMHKAEGDRIETTHLIDIRAEKFRTSLLTGGLPYHIRRGPRKLDTLLVVYGETTRKFRLGIGIDLPSPISAAMGFLAPRTALAGHMPPSAASGWLFHLDARNVVATYWEPLWESGRMSGYRVRLLETEGRRVQLGLRSFRGVKSAMKQSAGGNPPSHLPVSGDRVTIEMNPYEWVDAEAWFV
jgi:alpha-mannosidase